MTNCLSNQSEYIVYVDESGDHGMEATNSTFPVFVLAFCVFQKEDYLTQVVQPLQGFKFCHFGHDMIVLHEHEIRKAEGHFKFLINAERRAAFMEGLNELMTNAPFTVIASCIDKTGLKTYYPQLSNPYHLAVKFCLERLYFFLASKGQADLTTHVIFESRGKNEDNELELEFRRVCDGINFRNQKYHFEIIFAQKRANSSGLQLADLIARPIGLHHLRPTQSNRAFEIIKDKFDKGPDGKISGYGLIAVFIWVRPDSHNG
jgi:hypothetical protein